MKQAVAWFAENSVAANLLMVMILVGGFLTIPNIKKEIFPEMSVDMISINVPYLGAGPEEVEEGVSVRVEEAIQGLNGIKKITSRSVEGMSIVLVEVMPGYDTRELLDDVKSRVDSIDTFPDETERPVIQDLILRRQVINVGVTGDADEITLKRLGERVRNEIEALPEITNVELANARPYEISIEVSENSLRRHGLTFDYVANAVRKSSLDMPGGSVKTESGEILLRTKGQAYTGHEFEKLVLLTRPTGRRCNGMPEGSRFAVDFPYSARSQAPHRRAHRRRVRSTSAWTSRFPGAAITRAARSIDSDGASRLSHQSNFHRAGTTMIARSRSS